MGEEEKIRWVPKRKTLTRNTYTQKQKLFWKENKSESVYIKEGISTKGYQKPKQFVSLLERAGKFLRRTTTRRKCKKSKIEKKKYIYKLYKTNVENLRIESRQVREQMNKT